MPDFDGICVARVEVRCEGELPFVQECNRDNVGTGMNRFLGSVVVDWQAVREVCICRHVVMISLGVHSIRCMD